DLCTSMATRDAGEIARRLRALTVEAKSHLEHETSVLLAFRRDLESRSTQQVSRRLKTAMAAAIEEHMADHVSLRDRLAEVTRTVRNGRWAEGTSLCQVVEMWFLDHAVKYDIQIKTIIQSM